MARDLGGVIPAAVERYLTERGKTTAGKVVLLLTVDGEGLPHVALLSLWEVHVKARSELYIGLYPNSKTTANLASRGGATLVILDSGMSYYIKGRATLATSVKNKDVDIAIFSFAIEHVLEDELAGASISAGTRYKELPGTEPHREVLRTLRRISQD